MVKDIQKLLAKQNLALAKEYLDIAKFNQKYRKSYRGVVDIAYKEADEVLKLAETLKKILQKSLAG